MKRIIKVVCSFAIAMTTACGVICAVEIGRASSRERE